MHGLTKLEVQEEIFQQLLFLTKKFSPKQKHDKKQTNLNVYCSNLFLYFFGFFVFVF